MTAPGPAASPVKFHRRRDALAEVLRWDGSPAALEVLKAWGAYPCPVTSGLLKGGVRIWGSVHGYTGAMPGSLLVRRPDGEGADKYTPEQFAAAFHETPAETPSGELAAAELADALTVLARVRDLAQTWTADDGHGTPTWEMRVEADCGRAVLAVTGPGADGNPAEPQRRAE